MDVDRGRSADRLLTLTDGIVAIAITLLVLPLIEFDHALVKDGVGALLEDQSTEFVGCVISFFVIARLWWSQHRVFEHVLRWSRLLVALNIVWLFTIALMPVATVIMTSFDLDEEPAAIGIYLGLMAVSSALLTGMAAVVERRPELTDGHDDRARQRTVGSLMSTTGFTLAFVVGTLTPANYFALALLVVTGLIGNAITRNMDRPKATADV